MSLTSLTFLTFTATYKVRYELYSFNTWPVGPCQANPSVSAIWSLTELSIGPCQVRFEQHSSICQGQVRLSKDRLGIRNIPVDVPNVPVDIPNVPVDLANIHNVPSITSLL